MKNRIGIIISLFFLLAISPYSCKKDDSIDSTLKQDVIFSFEQRELQTKSAQSLKSNYMKEDSRYIVITIEKSNGEKVYESKRLDLYNFGGSFISQSLSLEAATNAYKMTEFLVLDANYKVIFAAPLAGAALAYLVSNPLPINFIVSKNQITKIVPEVLSTELYTAKDFGYASFDFNTIMLPIRFLTNVQIYDPSTANWQPTSAKVIIKGNSGDYTLFNDSIAAMTGIVNVKDGYDNYKISVSKSGYITKDTTLTNLQLKSYLNNPLIFLLTNETVTDIDGNIYNTIKIGTQVWMVENLKTTKYRNGDPIANITYRPAWSDLNSGAYCWYNNDLRTYKSAYGALYNWFSVSDSMNIAPIGWHVPSEAEWITLIDYLGGEFVAGGKLKESGLTHWMNPNAGATNYSGFTALPSSFRLFDGTFIWIGGESSRWWSSTSFDSDNAWYIDLYFNKAYASLHSWVKQSGFSVRCIRD